MSRIAIIDFEASCLPTPTRMSFPIEVAVGIPETGEVWSSLIRPEPHWLEKGVWDPASERLHNISRDVLLRKGRPRIEVVQQITRVGRGRLLVSDNPAYEAYWLAILTGAQPAVGSLRDVFAQIAGEGAVGAAMMELAVSNARAKSPPTHRAADDVRFMIAVLDELVGQSSGA